MLQGELSRARNRAQITQKALAEQVGASTSWVCAIERGKFTPDIELAFRWAEAIGLDIQMFLLMLRQDKADHELRQSHKVKS